MVAGGNQAVSVAVDGADRVWYKTGGERVPAEASVRSSDDGSVGTNGKGSTLIYNQSAI